MVVLVGGEALIVFASFVTAALVQLGPDPLLELRYDYGFYKILGITVVALLFLNYFDLYDPQRLPSPGETYFRLFFVLGVLAFLLAGAGYLYPFFMLGNSTFALGLSILTIALFGWRLGYAWLLRRPYLRERVYVLGGGERAQRLVDLIRSRRELGMDVVGWAGAIGNGSLDRDTLSATVQALLERNSVERVIVALSDRRGTMPVRELLTLRLSGVRVDEAGGILEKITGKIEVDELHPSWLLFSEGFRLNPTFLLARRIVSFSVALGFLLVLLPFIPLIALAIRLTSAGPVFYRQKRVGKNGAVFTCYKFRTMREDAEALTGPQWAEDDDPRVTYVGRWLRSARVDEIPQLWNVLRGEMAFFGPRPERPEFIEWLSREIPYHHLRHLVRPGISGWAQVRYRYGSSLEDSKEKLRYDLYYIKNMSLSLDFLILFHTFKIVLLGRGSR